MKYVIKMNVKEIMSYILEYFKFAQDKNDGGGGMF